MKFLMRVCVVLVWFLAGCSSHPDALIPEKPKQLALQAQVAYETGTSFETNDAIGIYPVRYENGQPGVPGDIVNRLNVKYVYDGKRWFAALGEDIVLDEYPVDLYAYYPYDETLSHEADKLNLSAYPFDLSGDQSIRITDFLWTKTDRVSSLEDTTRLLFSHLLTRFEIHLTYDTPQQTSGLAVHNLNAGCRINLRTGIAVAEENSRLTIIPVSLPVNPVNNDRLAFSYEAIVPPQRVTAGTPLFSASYNGVTMIYTLPSDMDFQAGKNYVFNLIVGEANPLRIGSVEISALE